MALKYKDVKEQRNNWNWSNATRGRPPPAPEPGGGGTTGEVLGLLACIGLGAPSEVRCLACLYVIAFAVVTL
jgi:hypothetical protein